MPPGYKAPLAGGGADKGAVPLIPNTDPYKAPLAGGGADKGTVPLPEGLSIPQTQTEAPEPVADEQNVPAGASTVENDRGQITKSRELKIPGPPKVAEQKSMYTARGTIYPALPENLQRLKAFSEQRILEAQKAQTLSNLAASGATEEAMMEWVGINERDAQLGQELSDVHFKRAQQNITNLRQKVDEARSLKINPYNWNESLGRGGRVSAAFAVLTGGFAAGQNNPNSVLKMMDTAIERDIAAQKNNIANVYENLKLQRGLNADESALFNEQMNAMNEIRAVNYAAILGRIQAAKQNAISEAHRLAYETAEDHYNLKLVESFAAAQKEFLRIDVEGPIRNAAHGLAVKQEMARIEEVLSARAVQQMGNGTSVGGAPTSAGQSTSAGSRLRPPPSSSAAVSRSAGRGTAPGAGNAATGASGPLESTGGYESENQGMSVAGAEAVAPEAAAVEQKVQQEEDRGFRVEPDLSPQDKKFSQEYRNYLVNSGMVPRHVMEKGGFAQSSYDMDNLGTRTPGVTLLDEAARDLRDGKPIRNGGMTGTADARVIAKTAPMPKRNKYTGGETSAAYKFASDAVARGEAYPELYERPASLEGERNTIVSGGKRYIVKAGARDKKTYDRLVVEVQKKTALTEALFSMADLVAKKGVQGIFTDEGGINIPGLNTDDPGSLLILQKSFTQAMNYIKQHDPTARISDQDLKIGLKAAVPFTGGVDKFIDFVQSLDGNSKDNTKREQVKRFLAKSAVEAARILWQNAENDVVPDLATTEDMANQARAIDEFVYTAH